MEILLTVVAIMHLPTPSHAGFDSKALTHLFTYFDKIIARRIDCEPLQPTVGGGGVKRQAKTQTGGGGMRRRLA